MVEICEVAYRVLAAPLSPGGVARQRVPGCLAFLALGVPRAVPMATKALQMLA